MNNTTNSILGIGNDIIEIKRVKDLILRYKSHALDRLFTKEEQKYCQKYKNPYPNYAGKFAAKEAVAKALGTGFNKKLGWLDFSILNNENKKPFVLFHTQSKHPKILITISHCKTYANAIAIWVA